MKSNTLLIAIVCGLLAALLFLAPLSLGGLGMMMSSFTAFPLFVSVLGFGTLAGVVSGVISALVVAFFFGPLGALIVLGATMGPALWIGHSAGLSRNENGTDEWFPLSQILLRLAAISAVIAIVMGVVSGFTIEAATAQASDILKQVSELQRAANDGVPLLSAEQVTERSAAIARLLPFMMPASLLLLMVINLRLAERFVRRRGWMLRPADNLPNEAKLPPVAVAVFAASIVGSFMGSELGLISQAIAGAFGSAFVLVGLAVVHFMTRGVPGRGFLLPVVYLALLGTRFLAPVFAILGVAETILQLRARHAGGSPST